MEDILVPIFICCIMPVAIVLISNLRSMNSDNRRSQILIKAIETDNSIDADKLAESLRKPQKSERDILNQRLLYGCIFSMLGIGCIILSLISHITKLNFNLGMLTIGAAASIAIGISYLIVYFVSRKQVLGKNRD